MRLSGSFGKPKPAIKRSKEHPFGGLAGPAELVKAPLRPFAKELSHQVETSKGRLRAVAFVVVAGLVGCSLEVAPVLADMILDPVAAADSCTEVEAVA